jgi:NAD(P)-dependent dehydrogenase (short-subunit alcohol dehydrogenase family)
VMATNVKGVWLALKYELRQMLKQGSGSIVNNASVAGLVGTATGNASYVASKHAVIGLTRAVALENARRGIRVNAVAPAIIDTEMGASYASALKITLEEFGRKHPIGRIGQPPEVAAAVLWLCSEQASFVTGHCLTIDGGFTAQ